MAGDSSGYIAALDIGTTTLRCHIVNNLGVPIAASYSKVRLHYPSPGYVEIVPDELWDNIIQTVRTAVTNGNISINQIKSLGISTQRATFVTWKRDTGQPLHNFITWKDLRASKLIKNVNNSFKAKALRLFGFIIYMFTRNKRFGVVSRLKFACNHVSMRLLWVLENVENVRKELERDNVIFGTVDTWLIYKLTGDVAYVTDVTNASATGLYDPFKLQWSILLKLFDIPDTILPRVVKNDYDFGHTVKEIFGRSIEIGCVMADQSASMFGSCLFKDNDLKITLGTGGFLDANTAQKLQPSLNGMYPLVGWQIKDELVYVSEVPCSDAGSLIEWMLNAGLIKDADESSHLAASVDSTDGVYFIPAFSGLGPPINDDNATTGFIGVSPTTTLPQLVRAVLEGLVFRIVLAYEMLLKERPRKYGTVSLDGGVSKNDFVCQLLADLTGLEVKRLSGEMSVQGVAFLAGLKCGFWKLQEELHSFTRIDKVFSPSTDAVYIQNCRHKTEKWKKTTQRFQKWNNNI